MAANDHVLLIDSAIPPTTLGATPDSILSGSSPAEVFRVWDFDPTTVEYMDFHGMLAKSYDDGGVTVRIPWSASTAVGTGSTIWGAAFRAIPDDAEDLDGSHTYVYNDASADLAPSAKGEVAYVEIPFTDGADMDSLAAGERFVLRIRRNTAGGDDMSGDAELHQPSGFETA